MTEIIIVRWAGKEHAVQIADVNGTHGLSRNGRIGPILLHHYPLYNPSSRAWMASATISVNDASGEHSANAQAYGSDMQAALDGLASRLRALGAWQGDVLGAPPVKRGNVELLVTWPTTEHRATCGCGARHSLVVVPGLPDSAVSIDGTERAQPPAVWPEGWRDGLCPACQLRNP